MPQLRRLANTAEDPVKLAVFYQEVFELSQIGEAGGAVFFLTERSISLCYRQPVAQRRVEKP